MRLAANHFDADVPVAGTYIRKAAVQIENAADALREGNANDLIPGARGSREGNRPRSSAWRCWWIWRCSVIEKRLWGIRSN
jgi:hypothetical protein